MYCKNCGSPIDDNAVFCPNCGMAVGQQPPVAAQPEAHKGENTLAVIGFILSLFTALIGLIVSAIALHQANTKYNGDGKGFAIAGIIIGAIEVAVIVIVIIIYAVILAGVIGALTETAAAIAL